jgi:CBS domain-containing protein
MMKPVVTCLEDDSVTACAQLMRERGIGFVPVLNAGGLVSGVVTDRDLALRVLALRLDTDTPVRTVMTREVHSCRPEDDLLVAEEKMASARKSRLVVATHEGRCVGVISLSDVAQADYRSRAGRVLREVTRREAAPRPQPAV